MLELSGNVNFYNRGGIILKLSGNAKFEKYQLAGILTMEGGILLNILFFYVKTNHFKKKIQGGYFDEGG